MPDYIRLAEEARAEDPTLGQKMGYSLAVSAREAQEARALLLMCRRLMKTTTPF